MGSSEWRARAHKGYVASGYDLVEACIDIHAGMWMLHACSWRPHRRGGAVRAAGHISLSGARHLASDPLLGAARLLQSKNAKRPLSASLPLYKNIPPALQQKIDHYRNNPDAVAQLHQRIAAYHSSTKRGAGAGTTSTSSATRTHSSSAATCSTDHVQQNAENVTPWPAIGGLSALRGLVVDVEVDGSSGGSWPAPLSQPQSPGLLQQQQQGGGSRDRHSVASTPQTAQGALRHHRPASATPGGGASTRQQATPLGSAVATAGGGPRRPASACAGSAGGRGARPCSATPLQCRPGSPSTAAARRPASPPRTAAAAAAAAAATATAYELLYVHSQRVVSRPTSSAHSCSAARRAHSPPGARPASGVAAVQQHGRTATCSRPGSAAAAGRLRQQSPNRDADSSRTCERTCHRAVEGGDVGLTRSGVGRSPPRSRPGTAAASGSWQHEQRQSSRQRPQSAAAAHHSGRVRMEQHSDGEGWYEDHGSSDEEQESFNAGIRCSDCNPDVLPVGAKPAGNWCRQHCKHGDAEISTSWITCAACMRLMRRQRLLAAPTLEALDTHAAAHSSYPLPFCGNWGGRQILLFTEVNAHLACPCMHIQAAAGGAAAHPQDSTSAAQRGSQPPAAGGLGSCGGAAGDAALQGGRQDSCKGGGSTPGSLAGAAGREVGGKGG
jgi:hypothetical protein